MEKKCSNCGIKKDIKKFYKDKRKPDGLYTRCKICHLEIARLYRIKRYGEPEYKGFFGINNPFFGKKHSKQSRRKMSESQKIRLSNLTRHWNLGKKRSIDTKNKLSTLSYKKWQNQKYRKHMINIHKGQIAWNKGKRNIKISGEKNCNWKGGITPLKKVIRELPEYKKWRFDIFSRDNFKCVKCGCNKSGNLNADHYPISFSEIMRKDNIKSKEEAINCLKLWDIRNGRTLCIPCHKKTPNYFVAKKSGLNIADKIKTLL